VVLGVRRFPKSWIMDGPPDDLLTTGSFGSISSSLLLRFVVSLFLALTR